MVCNKNGAVFTYGSITYRVFIKGFTVLSLFHIYRDMRCIRYRFL